MRSRSSQSPAGASCTPARSSSFARENGSATTSRWASPLSTANGALSPKASARCSSLSTASRCQG
ncbi:hypothetical protein EG19_10650 [Thermoanaerobaculum aquaticum]|uniref:Uncharacterized protein n=1 Tax=Thermoanaerobaculum aquaticum TaxID=1312852 RepID=A0A062XPT5_9BACT|nr:hypothetical protein EG19_10650 [Thermoanaerobaculum aquaticum]